MPVTLVGTTGPAFALPAAELHVDVESATVDISPQFIKEKTSFDGIVNNVAYGPMEMSLSLSGKTKTKGVTGGYTGSLLVSVLGTAFVPVSTYSTLVNIPTGTNITAIFGAPTTGLYLEKASISYGEGDYVAFAVDYKARAGVT
jgi:hypothetical protein